MTRNRNATRPLTAAERRLVQLLKRMQALRDQLGDVGPFLDSQDADDDLAEALLDKAPVLGWLLRESFLDIEGCSPWPVREAVGYNLSDEEAFINGAAARAVKPS